MPLHPIPSAETAQERTAESLRERILLGQLKECETIPNERDLADKLRVNRSTIRGAIAMLVAERLLAATPLLGTCVRDWLREGSSHALESLLLHYHGQKRDDAEKLTRQTLWLRRALYRSLAPLLCGAELRMDELRYRVSGLQLLFRKDGGVPEEVVQQEELFLCWLAEAPGNLPVTLFANGLRRILEVPSRCGQAEITITKELERFEALIRALERKDERETAEALDALCALREAQYVGLARGMSKRD